MSNAIENAIKQLAECKRYVSELERFIQIYEELEDGTGAISLTHCGSSKWRTQRKQFYVPRERRQKRGRPAEIVAIIERIIRQTGRPLTRGGTIAWRHKYV